ncbi:MAG: hypothetical protein JHC87_05160 [Thermoleophilaceae bacterium]|nr:hypothetical protein [Thermoleophilaceae bacterium]
MSSFNRQLFTSVALFCATAVALAGCGGSSRPGEPSSARSPLRLVWEKPPLVFSTPEMPNDRVIYGWIKNPSQRTVILNIEDMRLRTARGETQPLTGRFVASFTHRLQPYNKTAGQLPMRTRINTGLSTRIPPGSKRPLTASWREYDAVHRGIEIDYGSGTLEVPPAKKIQAEPESASS